MINSFSRILTTGARQGISRLALTLMMLFTLFGASAQEAYIAPDAIPNPNFGHPDEYVADPYNLMPVAATKEVNKKIQELRDKTTCEMAVAIVKTTGDMPIEEYAYDLFKHWGIGASDKDNGILLLIATDDHHGRIECGYGVEGILTDVACANIMRNDVKPAMAVGDNVGQAVYMATTTIYKALTNPAYADEIRSSKHRTTAGHVRVISKKTILKFMGYVAVLVFLFTLVLLIIDIRSAHNRDNYRRAMIWRNHLPTYWWGVLLSFGAALPIALAAWLMYRHARDVTEICTTCGGKMKKLPEDEDNLLLSDSQDFEEKLGTVDYDVWLCPDCGTVERFPFVERQLKYHKCPECGTIAENLVCDKVVQAPTTRKEGHGLRTYQCQYCRNIRNEGYVIPKKVDAGALAAGAIIGAAASRGNGGLGGGGGFGGGFGGGRSGGGGASGSW